MEMDVRIANAYSCTQGITRCDLAVNHCLSRVRLSKIYFPLLSNLSIYIFPLYLICPYCGLFAPPEDCWSSYITRIEHG
jgi:hypothetical protein